MDMTVNGADRVVNAKTNAMPKIQSRLKQIHVNGMPSKIFLIAYKQERNLELWFEREPNKPYVLFNTFTIAAMSGGPGPKRKEGDRQVPEGVYHIESFNPSSRFHLSLRVSYPNSSDKIRSDQKHPGSDIYIHGDNRSIGCLAMTDPIIEEIYLLALSAKKSTIPVYIFPCRMSGPSYASLKDSHRNLASFWYELEPIYGAVTKTNRPVQVEIGPGGEYRLISN